jgi:ABC-type dipeptide/oligopeptide/nickel transport system permease component
MTSFYQLFLLPLHNINRWVALVALVAITIYGIWGVLQKSDFGKAGRTLLSIATISIDVQLLLGLLIWFFSAQLQAFLAGDRSTPIRTFVIEHPLMGIIAMILIHVGSVQVKKDDTSLGKNRKAAIWGGVTLLFVIVGGIVLTGADRLLPNFLR